MHDDHDHEAGSDASNPWADRINEAYYDAMGAAFGQKTRERINWMCSQARGSRVLDVGCSQGIASILMAREGMVVTGVDIYPPAIEYAMGERAKEVESVQRRLDFRCGDLGAVGNEQFDTVVMGEVVEHQTNPDRFIRQASANVAPNGRLIITVPFGLNPWPDHKSTVFPRQLHDAIAEEFALASIEVIDGYVRVVADRRRAGEVAQNDLPVLLQETEKGALESQSKFYASNANAQTLAKAKSEIEARLATSQASVVKLEKQLRELGQEVALKSQAVAFAEQSLAEARKLAAHEIGRAGENALVQERQAARIESLLADLAVLRSLSEQASRTIINLESSASEAGKQVEALKRSLDSANRDLELARANGIQQKSDLDGHLQRIVTLEQELAVVREERTRVIRELEAASMATESAASERDALRRRLEEAEAELQSAREEWQVHRHQTATVAKELEARVESLRDQLATLHAKQATDALHTERLGASAELLSNQLKEVQRDLVMAQYKRHGHYAHLKAERERSSKLVAYACELHEENQRFRHSAALAIGRACLGLTSVRGMIGFPKALLAAWSAYRLRESGSTTYEPIKLPTVAPVVLPPPPSAALASSIPASGRRASEGFQGASSTQPTHSKDLSVIGWRQDIDPASLPVMSVLDEFSRSCFAPQAALVEPRPDNWEGLLEAFKPKLLLVESSWKGNHGTWQYRIANYANPPGRELQEMVAGFRSRGIPTVFWNKEDPVHFSNFIDSASKFDLILTTASEAVPRYQERTSAQVGVLQFAAEESLHNPIGSAQRNGKVCFAGSFYANRFQERRDDQLMLLDAASAFDFDIFDRNHQPNPAIRSDFAFPDRFSPFVRGRLAYDAIGRAYREYRVFLNVNSVIDSPTMFSRRVFELLACGTPVVSTWSKGTEETFGHDLIWHVRNREEAEEAIRVLMTDDREWRRRSLAGIRAVLSAHTYRHRFASVCQMVGIEEPRAAIFNEVLVVAEVTTQAEATRVLDSFHRQVMASDTSKRLLLACRGDIEVENADALVDVVRLGDAGLSGVIARSRRPGRQRMLAVISPLGVYGRHYLQDLIYGARYSGAAVIGKAVDGLDSSQYTHDVALDMRAILLNEAMLPSQVMDEVLRGDTAALRNGVSTFATDSANFVRMDTVPEPARVEAALQQMEV